MKNQFASAKKTHKIKRTKSIFNPFSKKKCTFNSFFIISVYLVLFSFKKWYKKFNSKPHFYLAQRFKKPYGYNCARKVAKIWYMNRQIFLNRHHLHNWHRRLFKFQQNPHLRLCNQEDGNLHRQKCNTRFAQSFTTVFRYGGFPMILIVSLNVLISKWIEKQTHQKLCICQNQ